MADEPIYEKIQPQIQMPKIVPVEATPSPQTPPQFSQTPPESPGRPPYLKLGIVAVTLIAILGGLYVLGTADRSLPGEPLGSMSQDPSGQIVAEKACSLPIYSDAYAGFSVGKPDGYNLEYSDGTIFLTQAANDGIGVLVYPVRLTGELSTEAFLTQYEQAIGGAMRSAGEQFSLTNRTTTATKAEGTIVGTYEGQPLAGSLWVEKEPGFLILKGYFAPQTLLEQEQVVLSQIVDCFQRKIVLGDSAAAPGTSDGSAPSGIAGALRVKKGRYFSYLLPDGWANPTETNRGVDILSPDGAAVVSGAWATGIPGQLTPMSWTDQLLPQVLTNIQVLGDTDLPAPASGWTAGLREFEGTWQGKRVHGVTATAVQDYFGTSSVMTNLRFAVVDQWPSYQAMLGKMAESITIISTGSSGGSGGSGVMLPRNNPLDDSSIISSGEYRDAVNDRAGARYQEATMGYDNVSSGSTGEQYQVPLNSWNETGPDGPGYYREAGGGDYEKLELSNE